MAIIQAFCNSDLFGLDVSNTIFKKWLPLELATHIRINLKYFVTVKENLTFFHYFQLYF